MNFHARDYHLSPLFKFNHILKLEDKIVLKNILLIKSINNLLSLIFNG